MAVQKHSWYRDVFAECGEDYADEFCIGMSALFLIGPTTIILGVLLMSDAIGNPPGKRASSYNADVRAWESTGYPSFAAAWPPSSFSVNVTAGGLDRAPVPLLSFDMELRTDVVTPHNNNGETAYSNGLWYSGSLDLWTAGWPSTDQYYSLELPVVEPVNLEAFSCTEEATSADGGPCAAPVSAGRRLASRAPACAHYYRQIQFSSSMLLLAQPPTERNPNWTVTATNKVCGQEYSVVRVSVTEAEYSADVATMPWPGAPPAWCGVWGTLTDERPNATAVSLRSADDPYVLAGTLTGCRYEFGLSKGTYRRWGLSYFVVPGALATLISLLTLLCLVARRRATVRSALGKATPSREEGTPLSVPKFGAPTAYGSTATVTGTGAGAKGFQRLTTTSKVG